ncbi:MAG: hypothetical protein PVJ43_01955 [Gemmatimonadales bacterium]
MARHCRAVLRREAADQKAGAAVALGALQRFGRLIRSAGKETEDHDEQERNRTDEVSA